MALCTSTFLAKDKSCLFADVFFRGVPCRDCLGLRLMSFYGVFFVVSCFFTLHPLPLIKKRILIPVYPAQYSELSLTPGLYVNGVATKHPLKSFAVYRYRGQNACTSVIANISIGKAAPVLRLDLRIQQSLILFNT